MSTTEDGEMLGKWRKARNEDADDISPSGNLRLLAVCAGTLILLVFVISGVQGISSAHSASIQAIIVDHHLLDDIDNSTLGFGKLFVINLPKRTDRRDSMSLAAAVSGLHVEYIDGVTEVDEEARPPDFKESKHGSLGAWRAHMDALRRVVELNLTSALILEDDADWDIRIKSQMKTFAKASRLLTQPLRGTSDRFLDPTYYGHHGRGSSDFDVNTGGVVEPHVSPYGDNWDVLWIGNCGTHFPVKGGKQPMGRVVISNDETVPESQHLNMKLGGHGIINNYPAHTRIVHRAERTMCTLAYAVSQKGARSIMYELGVKSLTGSYDNMLREICDGKNDRRMPICLSVQPQLFQHHRPRGKKSGFSDIAGWGGYNEQPYSLNIRWSTRVNFPKLVSGETDYIDLFRDGEEPTPGIG